MLVLLNNLEQAAIASEAPANRPAAERPAQKEPEAPKDVAQPGKEIEAASLREKIEAALREENWNLADQSLADLCSLIPGDSEQVDHLKTEIEQAKEKEHNRQETISRLSDIFQEALAKEEWDLAEKTIAELEAIGPKGQAKAKLFQDLLVQAWHSFMQRSIEADRLKAEEEVSNAKAQALPEETPTEADLLQAEGEVSIAKAQPLPEETPTEAVPSIMQEAPSFTLPHSAPKEQKLKKAIPVWFLGIIGICILLAALGTQSLRAFGILPRRNTPTPTLTATQQIPTATPSLTSTQTATQTSTATPTNTPTITVTPSPTVTRTSTSTPTSSPTPTRTPRPYIPPTKTPGHSHPTKPPVPTLPPP